MFWNVRLKTYSPTLIFDKPKETSDEKCDGAVSKTEGQGVSLPSVFRGWKQERTIHKSETHPFRLLQVHHAGDKHA